MCQFHRNTYTVLKQSFLAVASYNKLLWIGRIRTERGDFFLFLLYCCAYRICRSRFGHCDSSRRKETIRKLTIFRVQSVCVSVRAYINLQWQYCGIFLEYRHTHMNPCQWNSAENSIHPIIHFDKNVHPSDMRLDAFTSLWKLFFDFCLSHKWKLFMGGTVCVSTMCFGEKGKNENLFIM